MNIKVSKEELYELYIIQNKEIKEISKIFNLSISTVWRHFKYYNIIKSKELKTKRRKEIFKNLIKIFGIKEIKKVLKL